MSFDLKRFKVPHGFRGKSIYYVQLWWLVQATLFSKSPQFMYSWRATLLRLFGAKVGKNSVIRSTVKVTYPWKIEIGENVWIGDNVELYSLGKIKVGDNSVISQRSYICTGSHDYKSLTFNIFAQDIIIGSSTWLATDVYVAPGVVIGDEVVVGARSSVFKNIPSKVVVAGTPATIIKENLV